MMLCFACRKKENPVESDINIQIDSMMETEIEKWDTLIQIFTLTRTNLVVSVSLS